METLATTRMSSKGQVVIPDSIRKRLDLKEGAQFLVWWIMDAVRSRIKPLMDAGKTLLRHCEGLLSYFDHQISNGMTEGINNKIKTLKRQAYGYRDMEYFKLRLYHLHNQGYSLALLRNVSNIMPFYRMARNKHRVISDESTYFQVFQSFEIFKGELGIQGSPRAKIHQPHRY